jgi:hypothetical protein
VIYRWKYIWNYSVGIFPAGTSFFLRAFSVYTIVNVYLFFLPVELATESEITDDLYANEASSIEDVVGKSFTDGV